MRRTHLSHSHSPPGSHYDYMAAQRQQHQPNHTRSGYQDMDMDMLVGRGKEIYRCMYVSDMRIRRIWWQCDC
ncbi:hypothetical protein LINPERHAP1_LOCUS42621 [Linum perenne]